MILDTHIILWFLEGNEKLDKNLRDDIEYFNGSFDISILSLIEITNLVQLKRYNLGTSLNDLMNKLEKYNIGVVGVTKSDILSLEKLPVLSFKGKQHGDMVDRMLIATALSYKVTLVSADTKFPAYRKYGLSLMEITS